MGVRKKIERETEGARERGERKHREKSKTKKYTGPRLFIKGENPQRWVFSTGL